MLCLWLWEKFWLGYRFGIFNCSFASISVLVFRKSRCISNKGKMGFFKLAYLSSMNKLCTFECGFCLQGKSISIPIVLFAKCLISFTQQQMFLPGRRFADSSQSLFTRIVAFFCLLWTFPKQNIPNYLIVCLTNFQDCIRIWEWIFLSYCFPYKLMYFSCSRCLGLDVFF